MNEYINLGERICSSITITSWPYGRRPHTPIDNLPSAGSVQLFNWSSESYIFPGSQVSFGEFDQRRGYRVDGLRDFLFSTNHFNDTLYIVQRFPLVVMLFFIINRVYWLLGSSIRVAFAWKWFRTRILIKIFSKLSNLINRWWPVSIMYLHGFKPNPKFRPFGSNMSRKKFQKIPHYCLRTKTW